MSDQESDGLDAASCQGIGVRTGQCPIASERTALSGVSEVDRAIEPPHQVVRALLRHPHRRCDLGEHLAPRGQPAPGIDHEDRDVLVPETEHLLHDLIGSRGRQRPAGGVAQHPPQCCDGFCSHWARSTVEEMSQDDESVEQHVWRQLLGPLLHGFERRPATFPPPDGVLDRSMQHRGASTGKVGVVCRGADERDEECHQRHPEQLRMAGLQPLQALRVAHPGLGARHQDAVEGRDEVAGRRQHACGSRSRTAAVRALALVVTITPQSGAGS